MCFMCAWQDGPGGQIAPVDLRRVPRNFSGMGWHPGCMAALRCVYPPTHRLTAPEKRPLARSFAR